MGPCARGPAYATPRPPYTKAVGLWGSKDAPEEPVTGSERVNGNAARPLLRASAASPPRSMGFMTYNIVCRRALIGLFVLGLCIMGGLVGGLALPNLLIWTKSKCTVTGFTADQRGVCSSVTFRVRDTGRNVTVKKPIPTFMLQHRSCKPPTDVVGKAFTCFYDAGDDGSIRPSDLCVQEKTPRPKDVTDVGLGFGFVAACLAWRPCVRRARYPDRVRPTWGPWRCAGLASGWAAWP